MRSTTLAAALAATTLLALPAAAQRPLASTKAATRAATKAATPAAPVSYQIDATHSELTFRIRHLLGRVSGTFGDWSGTVALDTTNWANSRVDVAIKTASIDTKNEKRDAHLRSNDFFAADSFPTISFRSNKVVKQGKTLRIYGDLTIRGRTKPAVLVGEYGGAFKDPWGNARTAFTASTKIDRQAFGVSYNAAVETGTMLGDEVQIDIAIEAVQQK